MTTKTNTGYLVRELRQNLGLTQEKLAAKLGVTFPTINRWENNRAKPSPLAMAKIQAVLNSLLESDEATHRQLANTLLSEYFREHKL